MATTIDWRISNLERETADVFVYLAHYTVDAADDTYKAGAYGSINFERPETLIPYRSLKEADVIEWVKTALGPEKVTNIEEALTNQLVEQRSPTKAAGLPWGNWLSLPAYANQAKLRYK